MIPAKRHWYNKALISLSVLFNVFFLLLLVLTFTRKTSTLAYYRMDAGEEPYITAAFVISVPSAAADILFGQADFSLRVGTAAALQFSIHKDGQLNMAIDPLYDHDVISVEHSGYGLIIRGLAPGKTVLQTFGGSGIKNVAEITVTAND
jgi:hypothetical protein